MHDQDQLPEQSGSPSWLCTFAETPVSADGNLKVPPSLSVPLLGGSQMLPSCLNRLVDLKTIRLCFDFTGWVRGCRTPAKQPCNEMTMRRMAHPDEIGRPASTQSDK